MNATERFDEFSVWIENEYLTEANIMSDINEPVRVDGYAV